MRGVPIVGVFIVVTDTRPARACSPRAFFSPRDSSDVLTVQRPCSTQHPTPADCNTTASERDDGGRVVGDVATLGILLTFITEKNIYNHDHSSSNNSNATTAEMAMMAMNTEVDTRHGRSRDHRWTIEDNIFSLMLKRSIKSMGMLAILLTSTGQYSNRLSPPLQFT